MNKQDWKPGKTFFKHVWKFIGMGIGWSVGGLPGAVAGLSIGALFDIFASSTIPSTTRGDFTRSLLTLIAATMKADGPVRRSELNYVKPFLVDNFGEEGAKNALLLLKEILMQQIDLQPVCLQIRSRMNYPLRLQLMYFLVNLAHVDGNVSPREERLLFFICGQLGISPHDRISLWAMFRQRQQQSSATAGTSELDDAYAVLGLQPGADATAVKKAYRAMAVKYHPDKVAYLGEDVKKAAHIKFQKLNAAYEKVKKALAVAEK
jgi:DnaJ like chaperone protein